MREPPSLRDAKSDPELRGAPLSVFLHVFDTLNPQRFEPLKVSALASDIHMDEGTAWRALAKLIERGYLERGTDEGRIGTYRIVWDRSAAA
jgi:predicted transcriptional regulator